jgi:putative ABC transport system substrate-binding protein
MLKLHGLILAALLVSLGAGSGEAGQTKGIPRVGLIAYGNPPPARAPEAPLIEGLRELGWIDGQTMTLAIRYAQGRPERLPDLARELVASRVDLLAAIGTDIAKVMKSVTGTIPIVAAVSEDPVEIGLAASLSRPGSNMTGVTFISSELAAKRLELLKEIVPRMSRIAILWNPAHVDLEVRELESAARILGVRLQSVEVRAAEELEGAFRAVSTGGADALLVVPSRLINFNTRRIAGFALERRLPAVSLWKAFADAGGLITYGPNIGAMIRRAATHADKILKGAKPGDLPIERPTRFELTVNLKTAKALGLTIPPSILIRADHVIE